jgi:hypothetical protein
VFTVSIQATEVQADNKSIKIKGGMQQDNTVTPPLLYVTKLYFKTHETYFNLSLSSIRGMVFKDFNCDNLICAFLPALYNLKRN